MLTSIYCVQISGKAQQELARRQCCRGAAMDQSQLGGVKGGADGAGELFRACDPMNLNAMLMGNHGKPVVKHAQTIKFD